MNEKIKLDIRQIMQGMNIDTSKWSLYAVQDRGAKKDDAGKDKANGASTYNH